MEKLDDVIHISKQFKRQAETAVMRDLYFTENPSNIIEFCDAVLELLKEQRPVKPLYVTDTEHGYKRYVCGNCRMPVRYTWVNNGAVNAYCEKCGRKIAWEKTKMGR